VLLRPPASEGNSTELVFAATTGAGAEQLLGTRLSGMTGIAGWVMQEKQPALVGDAQNDPRFERRVDADTGMTTHSLIAMPLISKGEAMGVVEVVNKMSGAFDQHDVEVLKVLTSSAAVAIENARLYATEQQRVNEMARALDQQRELDRLQRQFIQNVSHELRTPLSIVRGHAEMLETGDFGELQAEQHESVTIILRRVQMLTRMVEDIVGALELERHELRRERIDMAQLVQASQADFQAWAQKADLALDAQSAPDLPPILGDSTALRRVLDNLLGNACKFTPAGGNVTMRLRRSEKGIELQVTDTGIGIAPEHLGRIFERFYQVDGSSTRRYGGIGLGLALVKEIVEAHGGQITVESKLGEGTTFTVLLPIA
jgi:signal transduction histidine kinase